MARYTKDRVLNNSSEYYESIRRNKKTLRHFETPRLANPGVGARTVINSVTHIWTVGDRFYKLANTYYADVRFWWVIAWYNGVPTEAHLTRGTPIEIPLDIDMALRAMGQ
tara:strand:+ start:143 stop:472 length:330 start_codon:yes stop_codon:yes gene_type:complete